MKDAGAKFVRWDYSSGSGTPFALAYAAAKAAGLEVIPILMIKATSTVAQVQAWANEILALDVNYVELGNEMNGQGQYGGVPNISDYKIKANAAILVLRSDPALKIASGGLAQYSVTDASHIKAVDFMQGIKDLAVDAFAFHAYGDWAWDTLLPQLMAVQPTADVWITEWGYYTLNATAEAVQATEVTKRISYMKTQPRIKLQAFYSGIDKATGGTNDQNNYGLYHTNGTPKPARDAYKTAVS